MESRRGDSDLGPAIAYVLRIHESAWFHSVSADGVLVCVARVSSRNLPHCITLVGSVVKSRSVSEPCFDVRLTSLVLLG